MADIEKVIAKGDRHRSVANTVMNTNRYVHALVSASMNSNGYRSVFI